MNIDIDINSELLPEVLPNIDWPKLREAVRAFNWELSFGPLQTGYWENVEPLEHFKWKGQMDALRYIRNVVYSMPTLYYDWDFDTLVTKDPWEDQNNWVKEDDPDYPDDEMRYIGPQEFYEMDPTELLPKDIRSLL